MEAPQAEAALNVRLHRNREEGMGFLGATRVRRCLPSLVGERPVPLPYQ